MTRSFVLALICGLDLASAQQAVSRSNASHYAWGRNSDGWYLSRSPELTVIEERMPAGSSETAHSHSRSRQFFYVLSGAASMEHDGKTTRLTKSEGIEIAPGVVHRISNAGKNDLRILVISQPPSHDDRIEIQTRRDSQ